jgi:hypothetical protein
MKYPAIKSECLFEIKETANRLAELSGSNPALMQLALISAIDNAATYKTQFTEIYGTVANEEIQKLVEWKEITDGKTIENA